MTSGLTQKHSLRTRKRINMNKYGRYDGVEFESFSMLPKPITTIFIGGDGEGYNLEVNINKKFNWFQKKMIKWCFGFEVKENK